jgi:hypothetical protein
VANVRNSFRTVAIEVCLLLNFAVVFDLNLFPVPTSKAQFIGNVLMNRQNVEIRSIVFILFYNAHCLLTHRIILH